jgi:hypothetical protein
VPKHINSRPAPTNRGCLRRIQPQALRDDRASEGARAEHSVRRSTRGSDGAPRGRVRLDPEFAAENVGYFTAPYEVRAKLGKPIVDREHKQVHVAVSGGVTAVYLGDQGCVTLPVGKDSVNFEPIKLKTSLPDASTQAWPMGDVLPNEPLPRELDLGKVTEAVDAAFDPPGGKDCRFSGDLEGTADRRAIRAGNHGADAARELVDG